MQKQYYQYDTSIICPNCGCRLNTRKVQTTMPTSTKVGNRQYMKEYMKLKRDKTRKRRYQPRQKKLVFLTREEFHHE